MPEPDAPKTFPAVQGRKDTDNSRTNAAYRDVVWQTDNDAV